MEPSNAEMLLGAVAAQTDGQMENQSIDTYGHIQVGEIVGDIAKDSSSMEIPPLHSLPSANESFQETQPHARPTEIRSPFNLETDLKAETVRFHTVKQLRDACREFGLKVSGKKDILVVRLAAFLISMDRYKREQGKEEVKQGGYIPGNEQKWNSSHLFVGQQQQQQQQDASSLLSRSQKLQQTPLSHENSMLGHYSQPGQSYHQRFLQVSQAMAEQEIQSQTLSSLQMTTSSNPSSIATMQMGTGERSLGSVGSSLSTTPLGISIGQVSSNQMGGDTRGNRHRQVLGSEQRSSGQSSRHMGGTLNSTSSFFSSQVGMYQTPSTSSSPYELSQAQHQRHNHQTKSSQDQKQSVYSQSSSSRIEDHFATPQDTPSDFQHHVSQLDHYPHQQYPSHQHDQNLPQEEYKKTQVGHLPLSSSSSMHRFGNQYEFTPR
eukprot:CAMPEP_0167755520 /NCGR_PEP_ID=MMETSP0110_2-20121227/8873_1 /TAXON_ID=629695 /ORGANISM="Gymnochlora sp., Strain CCMP2014" /LENGTH=432 /DNA_ID=CAMNT_0007641523 /DNA_START=9 /DNA_END=1307 /DNA_ORIENTATION=-